MTNYPSVVVPAVAPQPPQLSLLNSAVRPDNVADYAGTDIPAAQLAGLPQDLRDELNARKGEAWVRGLTYAPENHYAAETRDGCDFASVDDPPLPAPLGLAATPGTTGGSLADATYSYQVTAVNANGETTARTAVTAVVTGGSGSGSVALTWDKNAGDSVTYNVYGRVGGAIGLLATVGPFDLDQAPVYTDTGAATPGAAPPSSNTTGGSGSYGNLPIVTVIPYLLIAEDSCSTWGFEERDFKGRAQRLLDNAQHQAIEKEFWTGTLAAAKGYPNNYLTNSSSVTDLTPVSVPSVARGQQILQDALQQCGFGGRGMLHVQAQTTPNLTQARRVGNLLLDIFDNIIVPGVGYPGTAPGGSAPAAGTAWMYATDLVMVRVEDEGTVFPDTFAEAMDWGQGGQPNTLRFRAEKFAAAYFDAACHFAVKVNLAS